ncbi:uroporphyrinogen decarboxylase [Effusibacillus dendaii]|uniref:Uroporphyrinogen decarboxylase n=1 Tax=Effusibacillus dendaii TaxID=2743772 RepID=A0A7I8D9Q4_9BACL|nr:uroporphyrinogen decarboxylase [Effusibacillus dendaii]BCJ86888.1 uroporphyrinogen decarboxylase [Effusibacillus dendaii]
MSKNDEVVNRMAFNDTFLRACRRQPVDYTPVWYMRQAGRYQPEYRKIREKYSLMEICEIPEVCAEVTLLPIQQLNVDAAILFSDIMIPVKAMGVDVDIKGGYGPVIANPIQHTSDVEKLRDIDPEGDLPKTLETIRILRRELNVPLIGFAGAPFTLASYMIEGGPSKNYHKTKQMMYAAPDVWNALMDKLGRMIVTYMKGQVAAGAQAIQVFDSWIGSLSPIDYRQYVWPTMRRIFEELRGIGAPVIYFGINTGELLSVWKELPIDVIGVDWRVPLDAARNRVGFDFALQGNLDPAVLMAPQQVVEQKAKEVLDLGMQQAGYIFNLGHGVFPEVKVETLQRLTEFVHSYSSSVR